MEESLTRECSARLTEWAAQLRLKTPNFDAVAIATAKQAREAGKAVRFGRGPATVIGAVAVLSDKAVSQATLPAASAKLFARKRIARSKPYGISWGFFVFGKDEVTN